MAVERVTITLPEEVLRDIDRRDRNRSKFILQAVQRELEWRQREQLRLSLSEPHPESMQTAEWGIQQWVLSADERDADLLDQEAGKRVCWEPGQGWTEVDD
jgi:hypothetical protein